MCKLTHIVLKLKGMQMRHIGLLLVIIFSLSAYAADHPGGRGRIQKDKVP